MSLGTTPGVLIARQALDTLLEEFPLIRMISSDFSGEELLLNQPAKVQVANALTAEDWDSSTGYAAQATNQTEYDITIDQHVHVTYGFNDQERTSHNILLIERFARNAAHAIGKRFMDELCALVVNDPFTNKTVIGPGAMNRLSYVAMSKKLGLRKVPKAGRFSILNSDYFADLSEDETLIANPGSPAGTVRSGEIGNVQGISVTEYPFLDDNDEYLAGFAGTAEALLIATRVPVMPDAKALQGGTVENVTEPNTGLTLQLRQWYDFQKGKEFRTYTLMFGVGTGDPARLERLVTQE